MNIFNRIKNASSAAFRAFNATESQMLTLMDATGWLDGLSSAGESVTVRNSLESSPVAAAHRVITNSLGNLPLKIYQKRNGIREEKDHTLNYVLSVRANANMTPFVFKKAAMSQALFYGTCFIYPYRRAGRIAELILLPSSMAQGWNIDGKLWYSFTIDGMPTYKFSVEDLIICHWETQDGINGIGLLDMARESIATDKASQKYAGKFYRNGARVSGIIEVDSQIDKDKKDKVREEFERMTSGMDNAFRTAVLDLGMKYTQLGISQQDAQFIESRNFTVEEISRFTGVPLYKMQSGKQSYQSNEQQSLDYVVGVLQPIVTQWEQEFAYKLFSDRELCEGYYMRFNLSAELRSNDSARSTFFEKMIALGIYNQDDCRAEQEMNPLPNGQGSHYWMSKNYGTIENVAASITNGEGVTDVNANQK